MKGMLLFPVSLTHFFLIKMSVFLSFFFLLLKSGTENSIAAKQNLARDCAQTHFCEVLNHQTKFAERQYGNKRRSFQVETTDTSEHCG